MSDDVVRIAMWSGPRNISTAMMRSFGARADTAVIDEPFYAVYLAQTGLNHPMRDEVLASQSQDWRVVAKSLIGGVPDGKHVFYQKHMTHHMLPGIGRDWMAQVRNAFLIRDPAAVLASYIKSRGEVRLADIGIVQQRELFDQVADRLGHAPPVIEGVDVLKDPTRALAALCEALTIDFTNEMLSWPPGRRETDGVWAPAWYHAVEQSTGFGPPPGPAHTHLPHDLQRIADEALSHYEALVKYKLHR
jgi:Sulfotransferase domain